MMATETPTATAAWRYRNGCFRCLNCAGTALLVHHSGYFPAWLSRGSHITKECERLPSVASKQLFVNCCTV